MNQNIRKIKILLIALLVLSINAYGAVISDSDGAAFVTKQEFESLKSSLNEQINKYNDSLDRKIDGSIADAIERMRLDSKVLLPIKYFDYKVNEAELSWYGGTDITKVKCSTDEYLVNNVVAILHMYRRSGSSSTGAGSYVYRVWNGYGVWNADKSTTTATVKTNLTATATTTKNYMDYLICDKNDRILYFAKTATTQNWHAFNTTSAHADQPGTMRNYITWAGGDRWYTGTGDNGPRWVAQWGETDINTKYESPLCPNITTKVPRARIGIGTWATSAMKGDGRNTRDMLTWTEVEKNQDLTMSALFNIPKSYFPEGNSNEKKALNEFSVANLVDASSLNGAMKYGVYIATTTLHSNLKITINGTKAGNVTFRVGTGNSSTATVKATKSISANTDTEIKIEHLDADTNIYLIYAPTGNDYGKINKLQILQEQTWEYD